MARRAPRRRPARTKPARISTRKRRLKARRKAASTKAVTRKRAARKVAARKATARKAASRQATSRTSGTATRRSSVPRVKRTAKRALAPAPRSPSGKAPRLDRARRTLEEVTPGMPSSLDLDRHASAARTGRAEIAESRIRHAGMTPGITAGDPDADVENAYFSGEEAPGGDNPTPDQDVVDEIGRALGVEYQDNEELRASDKVVERDKHRWELDPASSDDYKDRD